MTYLLLLSCFEIKQQQKKSFIYKRLVDIKVDYRRETGTKFVLSTAYKVTI